jgi:hypothetical protein
MNYMMKILRRLKPLIWFLLRLLRLHRRLHRRIG